MRQFLKGSILLLVLSSWMLSCQEENKFNWENAIIRSEKDAILISSFDVVSLIKKSNPSENEQLNFSQKMMLRAATSSLASSSAGFRIEGQHHMFVVPKGGEINGGVFYPGEITNYRKFSSTVQDVFGDNTNAENQVNYVYNKDYNVMLGFDSDHFIMGSSYDSAFLKQKISSYFTVNQSEMEDPFLEEFLSFEGDLGFYFDGKKTLNYISNLSAPYLNTWLPFLELQDKKAILKTAFNEGAVQLSFVTENKEDEYVQTEVMRHHKPYFLDSSFLNAECSFNDVVLNNIIEKEINKYVDLDSILHFTSTYLSLNTNALKSIHNISISLKKLNVANSSNIEEMSDDWESEEYWDDDDFESQESEISNSFYWLASFELDSNYQSEMVLKEPLYDGSLLYKVFTKNGVYLSNDSAVIYKIQSKKGKGLVNSVFGNNKFPFKFILNLENLPSYEYLTILLVPFDEYVDLSKIQDMELVGNPNHIMLDVNLKERKSNALHVLTKDFWKFLIGLKLI